MSRIYYCERCSTRINGPGVCGKCYVDPMSALAEEMKPQVADWNDAVTKAFFRGIKSLISAGSSSSASKKASPQQGKVASASSSNSADVDAPSISVEVSPSLPAAEFNSEVILLFAQIYNAGDKVAARKFADLYWVDNYATSSNGKAVCKSREEAYKGWSSSFDRSWQMVDAEIVEASATSVQYKYIFMCPGIAMHCSALVTFANGRILSSAYKTHPKQSQISIDINPMNLNNDPTEINKATILLYVKIYNSGDKVLARSFVNKFYDADYKSITGDKVYSNTREEAYFAICTGMDKKWQLTEIKIAEASPKHLVYSYTCVGLTGSFKCNCNIAFQDGRLVANTWKITK